MDAMSPPIFLPRNQQDDLQPTVYVVTVHNNPSATTPRVQVTAANPGYGPQNPLPPSETTPADTHMHPAFYTSGTGTVTTPADKHDWAAAKQFVPRQNAQPQDTPPAKPVEQTTPSSLSTLTQLLEEIRRTQTCSHCCPTRQANSVRLQRTKSSADGLCYYHRQFGRAALKCRPPCALSDHQPRKTQ